MGQEAIGLVGGKTEVGKRNKNGGGRRTLRFEKPSASVLLSLPLSYLWQRRVQH